MLCKLSICIFLLSGYVCYGSETLASEAFKAIGNKNIEEAMQKALMSNSSALVKIVKCQQYLDSSYPRNQFSDIAEFITENPNWTYINKIKLSAEKAIKDSDDTQKIYNWFAHHAPKTSNGYWYYAVAASKHEQNQNKLSNIIKNSWIKSNWSDQDNKEFLARYGSFLTKKDYISKIENTIASGTTERAKNLFYLVDDKEHIKLFQIQIDLIEGKGSGVKAFEKLNKKSRHDNATALAYLLYFRKSKADYHEKFHDLLTGIKDDGTDSKWTEVRLYFARDLMGRGHLHKAYSVISINDPAEDISDIVGTSHLSGLIAYRMHKYDLAAKHFARCTQFAQKSATKARSYYWLASSYARMHDKKSAKRYFEDAAKYNYVFYGQLSLTELGIKELEFVEPNVSQTEIANVAKTDLAEALRLVGKYGGSGILEEYARAFIHAQKNEIQVAAAIKYIYSLPSHTAYMIGTAGREAVDRGVFLRESFPKQFKISNPLTELPLIYSLIRQETTYNQYAIDSMDGRGLMQIMPYTCKSVAKSLGIPCDRNKLVSDASYNILLGSKHIADHLDTFDGYYVTSIPSYNAGSARLKEWIAKYGNPKNLHTTNQVAIWIESIPFQITRGYVQKILEVIQIYRVILNNDKELKIKNDLLYRHHHGR